MDRGGGTDLRTVNRTVNSTGIGSEGKEGQKGRDARARRPLGVQETLRGVTWITKNLDTEGSIQERFREKGGTGDQPGMMGKIVHGSGGQNGIL